MKYKYEDFNEYSLDEVLTILQKEIKKNKLNDNGLIEDIKEELRNQDESVAKCNELIENVVDILNNRYCDMVCPMCGEKEMTYIKYKGTHIYICEPCPFVGFELYDQKDVKNATNYFGGKR